MPVSGLPERWGPKRPPLAIILGLNEIASAVAVGLHRAGYGIVMSHDPSPPVLRRGMSFFDVLYDDAIAVEGVEAICVEDTLAARAAAGAQRIAVTRLGLMELLTMGGLGVLIDARMQKYTVTPDLRGVAPITAGIGPGFTVGRNCDLAIETKPGQEGNVLRHGSTIAADGVARPLGGKGRERFIYADRTGSWRTALDVGARVYKGLLLGVLEGESIAAPFDGVLRGIVRDGIAVPSGTKLIEIDTRGRRAQWTGIDDKGYAIAQATCLGIQALKLDRAKTATRT